MESLNIRAIYNAHFTIGENGGKSWQYLYTLAGEERQTHLYTEEDLPVLGMDEIKQSLKRSQKNDNA